MPDRITASCACGATFCCESPDKYGYMYVRNTFEKWIAIHNKCPEPKLERFRINPDRRKR